MQIQILPRIDVLLDILNTQVHQSRFHLGLLPSQNILIGGRLLQHLRVTPICLFQLHLIVYGLSVQLILIIMTTAPMEVVHEAGQHT